MLRREALPLSALLLASPLLAQTSNDKNPPPAGGDARDLERMRSLIAQMQTNLVNLPSGYSAEKHQFELEIEMWQVLVGRLERAGEPQLRNARP
jgi:hypothetical protein